MPWAPAYRTEVNVARSVVRLNHGPCQGHVAAVLPPTSHIHEFDEMLPIQLG